jgi:hypothetical protein
MYRHDSHPELLSQDSRKRRALRAKKVDNKYECVYSHSQSYVILYLRKLNNTIFLHTVQT